MTYFDIKDVVFVNKIANCRKSAKEKVCACRGRRLDFWKISAGLPRKIQRSPNITEARQSFHICSKAAFLRATRPREGLHNGHADVFANRLPPFHVQNHVRFIHELRANYTRIFLRQNH